VKVTNPATGAVIRELADDGAAEVARKHERARRGQRAWAARPYEQRAAAIRRFRDLLGERRDALARTLTSEMGKPITQSGNELDATPGRIDFFLETTPGVLRDETVLTREALEEAITLEPLGVVANVSAWNYPYFVGTNVFIPALLTGNAVLYKPSEYATLTGLAIAPVRVGLAVADAGLGIANDALGMAQRTLGEANSTARSGSGSFAHMLGIDDAVERANRLARLMDDDAPLGRALAPNGPIDRLLRPGGLVDQLTTEGGLLDRLTAENGAVSRALAPGGLVDQVTSEGGLMDRMTTDDGALSRVIAPGGLADQLLANDGLIERVLRENGVADRLLAEGGLLDTLTAENGPLLKLADVADTLNRLAPGLEALAPTIDALHDAVVTLSQVVNPLSNIADRIPIPGWRPRRSSTSVRSQRVIDAEN